MKRAPSALAPALTPALAKRGERGKRGLALLFLSAGILAACGRVERKVRIAVLTDLTGPRAVYGEGIRRAAVLALEEQRSALLAAGWDVELRAFDAGVSAPELDPTIRGIASDPDTFCAVVHTDSDGNLAAAKIFHPAGIAHILPAETASLPDPASQPETIFLSPDDRSHGASDAEGALSRAAVRILLTTNADAHALSIAGGFCQRAQSGGLTVYNFQIISEQDLADWTSSYQSIRPDLVYFSGSSQLALSLLDRMAASGFPGSLFFAQDNPEDPLPSNFTSDSVTLMFSPATADSGGAAVVPAAINNYRAAYGSDPPALAALGYDAASFCVSPLLKKGTGNLSPANARSWVLDQLRVGDVYQGLTGSYTFGSGRPCQILIYLGAQNPLSGWTPVPTPGPALRTIPEC
jgi:ABC-type branched-subunit amino acid transport system substrate-binding protein